MFLVPLKLKNFSFSSSKFLDELRLRAPRKGEGEGAASEEGTEETHREKKTEVSAQWSGQSEKLRVFRVLEETGRLYCTISQA